jgi:hypothetical protein
MAHVYIWHLVYILLLTTSPLYSSPTQQAYALLKQFIGKQPTTQLKTHSTPTSTTSLPIKGELVRAGNNYALIYDNNEEGCSVITRCGRHAEIEDYPFHEIVRFEPRLKLKNTISLEKLLSEKHLNE